MANDLEIMAGSRVAVVGLGVSGRAAVRYALQQKAEVFISDIRSQEEFVQDEGHFAELDDVHLKTGGHSLEFLTRAEIVIVSPGVTLAPALMNELQSSGLMVVGELAFAPADKQIVAITGTNGKTTVTTLLGELLRGAGKEVFVGGNIGTSLFDYLCAPQNIDLLVLEASSFQLETAGNFAPDVAVLLNISPDHLDRHGDMEGYRKAKMKIFSCQNSDQLAIINGDDGEGAKLLENFLPKIIKFGIGDKFEAGISANVIVLYPGSRNEKYSLAGTSLYGLIGGCNSAAAILAARYLGCSTSQIQGVLNRFTPLEHRMEFVREVDGVGYYNDSKATNTGAVVAALGQLESEVILIAGGRDKGDDYSLLKPAVSDKVRAVVAIGESADLLEQALRGSAYIVRALSMSDAVKMAGKMAVAGDSVLLSPACSSFDMFADYGHRGRVFKEEVGRLKNSRLKKGAQ
jgi:UDP-N-acetylmuramoylalanine--D-glutamate ligase